MKNKHRQQTSNLDYPFLMSSVKQRSSEARIYVSMKVVSMQVKEGPCSLGASSY